MWPVEGAARRRRRFLGWVLAAGMLAPPIVAIVVLAGRTWHPYGDFAIIDLRVRDVWSAHPPLTGLHSRPGWNHPGPALFLLIAPISAMFGQAPWATHIGGAVLEAVAMGWLAWVTWRAGLPTMLAAAAVVGMTYLAIGPWVIRQPWNLHVPLIWFILVLFLAILVATGSFRQLIGLTIAATIVVQTHVGFVAPVAATVGFALTCVGLDFWRTRAAPERWRSTVTTALIVLTALWLPPVLDVALHWPGNLGKIAVYFAGGNYTHVGLGHAAGIVAAEFRFLPPWLGGVDHIRPFNGFVDPASMLWLLVPAALLGAGGLAGWRSRDDNDRRRIVLAAILLLVAVVAISRADYPVAYTFQWRVVAASFVTVASVQAVATFLSQHHASARVMGAAVACAFMFWGAVDLGVRVATDPGTHPLESQPLALAAALPAIRAAAHLGTRARVVLVRTTESISYGGLFDGVINELDRAGAEVRVDSFLGRFVGTQRVGRPSDSDEIWYVAELGSHAPALQQQPGARVIAQISPLSPREDAELARIQTTLREQLVRAGHPGLAEHLDSELIGWIVRGVPGVDPRLIARAAQLNHLVSLRRSCRCVIVAVPGGRRPPSHRTPAATSR